MAASSNGTLQYIPKENKHLTDFSDAILVVKGEQLPVSSAILALHSPFFCDMIHDLQNDPKSKETGKLTIPLDESITVEDAVLMLSFIYGKQKELETAEDAYRMIELADKYNIPCLTRTCAVKLKGLVSALKFVDSRIRRTEGYCDTVARSLGVADRFEGIEDLREECQRCIFKDLIEANKLNFAPLREAIKSLDVNGVSASSIAEVAAVLAYCGARRDPNNILDSWENDLDRFLDLLRLGHGKHGGN